MTETLQNSEANVPQEPEYKSTEQKKKKNNPLLIIAAVFVALVVFVFITQQKEPISWVTDYEAAFESARQQNKPLLLVFYKPFAQMYVDAKNNTYNDPDVKKYVESNFIPVLIDCDEYPDLANRFGVDYYPSHFVKHPDHEKVFGPRKGWDPPSLFIEQMQKLLDELNNSIGK